GAKKSVELVRRPFTTFDRELDQAYVKGAKKSVELVRRPLTTFDRKLDQAYVEGAKKVSRVAKRPAVRAERVDLTEMYDRLIRFGADPIPTIAVFFSNLFIRISMSLIGVVAYPYAFINYIIELITKEPGTAITSISEKRNQLKETFKPTMPYIESIGFALFIVAIMLTIYIIYIALEYILHF
ncbi:MAG: hypothetical protein QMC78_02895, partial [Methanocellales archaeon]|nr:hypothetical protein [Methanocellales archaeon]